MGNILLGYVILSYIILCYILISKNQKSKFTTEESIYSMCLLVMAPISILILLYFKIVRKWK